MATDPSYAEELPISDIERRMGIPSLASLHHERDEMVKQVAPLRARHGPGGVYDDERKILLSQIQSMIRAKAAATDPPTRITEAFIDQESHAHDDYIAFVTTATMEKIAYAELENQINGIADAIVRGNTVARYLTAELGLTPRLG